RPGGSTRHSRAVVGTSSCIPRPHTTTANPNPDLGRGTRVGSGLRELCEPFELQIENRSSCKLMSYAAAMHCIREVLEALKPGGPYRYGDTSVSSGGTKSGGFSYPNGHALNIVIAGSFVVGKPCLRFRSAQSSLQVTKRVSASKRSSGTV